MSTGYGRNMKTTVDRALRAQVRRFYEEGLGCRRAEPILDLDVFEFTDGCHMGVYFVDPPEALTPEQALKATWIEFTVEDVEAAARRLPDFGATVVPYHDKAHSYFQAPGGQVFRLAPAK